LDIEAVPSIRRNPAIADIFHRLDFAERQGSGLKRICEETSLLAGYTDAYAPQFLSTASAFHVILKNMNYDLRTDLRSASTQVSTQDERLESLLEFCSIPRTREEMQQHYGVATREYFRKKVLKPLLESGHLQMTIPDKPNSRNQQYVRVENEPEGQP
jgi:ATP-dependent DNA helicase RecG